MEKNLISVVQNIYASAGLGEITHITYELESSEYSACRFSLNGLHGLFRVAKITPKKKGQFVTLWKRPVLGGEIAPFCVEDDIDFVVVNLFDDKNQGQFIFNKDILKKKNILSQNGEGGKRAFRLYPPWEKDLSKEALKTQNWQLPFFLCFKEDIDLEQVRGLFSEIKK